MVGAGSVALLACLPLVRAMQIDIELLASTEGIALGKTYNQLGTYTACGFALDIGLYIEIIRLVENQVECGIQGIALNCGVTRSKLKAGIVEDSHRLQMLARLLLVLYPV